VDQKFLKVSELIELLTLKYFFTYDTYTISYLLIQLIGRIESEGICYQKRRSETQSTASICPGVIMSSPEFQDSAKFGESLSLVLPAAIQICASRLHDVSIAFERPARCRLVSWFAPATFGGTSLRHVAHPRNVFVSSEAFAEHAHVHVKHSARGIIFWLSGA